MRVAPEMERQLARPVMRSGLGTEALSSHRVGFRCTRDRSSLQGRKDLRAYAVQAYFNGRQVRITEPCYRKTVSFKGVCINHLWTQINSFVLGDREASKRADDLLDAAVYAASVAFRPRLVKK